jgi:hypothetical protein
MLADGGLSINAKFDPVLADETTDKKTVFVLDLYARDGGRPKRWKAQQSGRMICFSAIRLSCGSGTK